MNTDPSIAEILAPLVPRRYSVKGAVVDLLISNAIRVVFPDGLDSTEELTEGDIAERFAPYLSHNLDAIQAYLDLRYDLSERPIAVYRRVLKLEGMKLARKQVMVDGERFMVYTLESRVC